MTVHSTNLTSASMSANNTTGEQELIITRTFNAPRELVFNVWTQPEHLIKWWGPKGMTTRLHKFDLAKGGIFHYSMELGDGKGMWWGKMRYDRVDPHEYLDFIISFSDENAGTTVHPLSATWPLEILNKIQFTENDNKTTIHMRGYPINASDVECQTFFDNEKNVEAGTKSMLDVLEEYLESLTTK